MKAIQERKSSLLRPEFGERYYIFCPACYEEARTENYPDESVRWWENCALHAFSDKWDFDGNMERPTISPSLLVKGIVICHSFIKDGKIQYLGDCTHKMAGQTVDLMDVPERFLAGDY